MSREPAWRDTCGSPRRDKHTFYLFRLAFHFVHYGHMGSNQRQKSVARTIPMMPITIQKEFSRV